MAVSDPQIALAILAAGVTGVVTGLLVATVIANRRTRRVVSEVESRSDSLTRERDYFANKFSKARATIKSLQAEVAEKHNELSSVSKESKVLTKNVLALRGEREQTKLKITTLQKTLASVKQRTLALQREFDKVGDFYKGELAKSFNKRKTLEKELENARSEQESFARLVESSVLEHGSPKEMMTSAHLRLEQLKVLERTVGKLEKENQQLRDDAVNMKRDYHALQKDLKELDELKIYNKQLVDCVESLENSRQQHEQDAAKYRDQAAQSEQLSDTLRLKLEDLQQNFADIENQQHIALENARDATATPISSIEQPSQAAVREKKRKAM